MKLAYLAIFTLAILGFSPTSHSQAVVKNGSFLMTIRERTDTYVDGEGLNSIQYTVYKFDGGFVQEWKAFSTVSHHAFVSDDGKAIVLLPKIGSKESSEVFLRFFNRHGLIKEFTLKEVFNVSELKIVSPSAVAPVWPYVDMFQGSYGIMQKFEILSRFKPELRTKIDEILKDNEYYLYYKTTQNKELIHSLKNGEILFKNEIK